MCGICGRFNFSASRAVQEHEIRRLCGVMAHRGPDDEGVFMDPGARFGFGMRRLSIIDLGGGHQPISNEDDSVLIVFNGEIYNFQELRPDLERKGHVFKTRADTEVILHLYEESGSSCVDKFNGMFAFAVWNRKERTLFLARDRVGIKPLYIYEGPGFMAFASEIKCLLELEDVPREVDEDALELYLTLQYVPAPLTMFKGIRQLMPGEWLMVRDGKISRRVFWDLPQGPSRPARDEAAQAEELLNRLEAAVTRRLIADVPLGAFLSGGLDSSAIVALMARHAAGKVTTFSIGFEERGFNETPFSSQVSKLLGTDHDIEVLRPRMDELLPRVVWHMDLPMADPASVPMYLLSRMARRKVKVVLTGEGADELFGGYEKYRIVELARRAGMLGLMLRPGPVRKLADMCIKSKKLRAAVRCLANPDPVTFAGWTNYLDAAERSQILGRDMGPKEPWSQVFSDLLRRADIPDDITKLMYIDFKVWLPDDILTKVDKMSMAHGLEARVPFLEHLFAEWAFKLPADLKVRGRTLKYILKKSADKILPPEIVYRKKHGFDLPIARWLRGEMGTWAQSVLSAPRLRTHNLLDPDVVSRLLGEHQSGKADHGRKLWMLINFQLWHEIFFEKRPL